MLSTVNLDFLAFHNYYDRVVDVRTSRASYSTYKLITKEGIDFNPNDGISTYVILEDFSNVLTAEPDYMLVWYTEGTDPTGIIHSRWYIMESKRLRGGLWKLTLRRDLLADYNLLVLNNPCYIQKGMLKYNDPMIFNAEGMTFNQIKTKEYLLKDNSDIPWLVCYYAKKDGNNQPWSPSGTFAAKDRPDIVLNTPITDWQYYLYFNHAGWGIDVDEYNLKITTAVRVGYPAWSEEYKWFLCGTNYAGTTSFCQDKGSHTFDDEYPTYYRLKFRLGNHDGYNAAVEFADLLRSTKPSFTSSEKHYMLGTDYLLLADSLIVLLQNNNNLIIETTESDSTHKYYKAHISNKSYLESIDRRIYNQGNTQTAYAKMKSWADAAITAVEGEAGGVIDDWETDIDDPYSFWIHADQLGTYQLSLTDITTEYNNQNASTFTYNFGTHIETNDVPYNICCLPYADCDVWFGPDFYGQVKKDIALRFVSEFAETNDVYDIQLLPYCPVDNVVWNHAAVINALVLPPWQLFLNPTPGQTTYVHDGNWSPIYTGSNPSYTSVRQIIMNVPLSSFTRTITAPNAEEIELNAVERKVKILTKMTRICSPNYAGVFEFNKQMNDGVHYYEANCTYKPYNPYIHVNPDFAGLYGGDYNDQRGLVCGGDFSLARAGEAWKQYQINNRNYQALFDRSIQNLQVNQGIQMSRAWMEMFGNSADAIATGFNAGAKAGPVGGVVGALGGGLLSAVGGRLDLEMLLTSQEETMDYTKDTFRMNLENIKALPNTLNKVSAFDINSKIFPYIEEYEATQAEEYALRNKLKYSGMTVGRVDHIAYYKGSVSEGRNFVQGQLILVDPGGSGTGVGVVHMDTHQANELYNEIQKGFRI